MGRQTKTLGRAQFQSVPGADTTLAGLEGLLDQARNIPTDPGLEAQIVAAIRQQAGAGVGAGGPQTPAGLGLGRGLSQQAVGAAISGTDAIRTSRFLQRFQAQQSVLQGLAGLTQGGFKGGPVEALVNERAMIRATQMRINAERNMSFLKMGLAAAGTATSALTAGAGTPDASPGATPSPTRLLGPSGSMGTSVAAIAPPGPVPVGMTGTQAFVSAGSPVQVDPRAVGLLPTWWRG